MYHSLIGFLLVSCAVVLCDAAPGSRALPAPRFPLEVLLDNKHRAEDLKHGLADSSGCKNERTDCDRIEKMTGGGEALKAYCNQWRNDPAVKGCKETCGFCKAPSPEGCKNERTDCDRIVKKTGGDEALKAYCNQWRDDPAVKGCKETCGFCSKPPSPTIKPETAKPETKKPTEKPTQKTTKPTFETFTGFQKTCLEAHNDFRAFHGVPPLKWSPELSRDAQNWANHLAATGKFDHDPTARGKDQGENLYYEGPAKRLCGYKENQGDCLSCETIVQVWYNEEVDYDYNTGEAKTPSKVVTHFTQLIWKASKELGIATAVGTDEGGDTRLVAVARYSPMGNRGEFKENVPPPDLP